MCVNVSACTCVLDDLQRIVCLGSALSGGSPLYALIIHTQLLLAGRNSAQCSFLHPFIFFIFLLLIFFFFCCSAPRGHRWPVVSFAPLPSPLGRFCLGRIRLVLITFVILRMLIQGRALRLRQTDAGQRDIWNHSRSVSRRGGLDGIPYQAHRPAQKKLNAHTHTKRLSYECRRS